MADLRLIANEIADQILIDKPDDAKVKSHECISRIIRHKFELLLEPPFVKITPSRYGTPTSATCYEIESKIRNIADVESISEIETVEQSVSLYDIN